MSWSQLFKGAVHHVKDSGASAAIQRWLARELADYGEVLDFSISSRTKTAELHILLKGETEKLAVHVDEYELSSAGDIDYITVRRARASREWVNAVLRKFVLNKRHEIPRQYSSLVKLILNG